MADNQSVDLFYTLKPAPGVESALQRDLSALEKRLQFNSPFAPARRDIRDLQTELDRANQRVITLGASFAVLSSSIRTLKGVVQATVEVEKSLADINSVFKLGSQDLDRFSKQLFDSARLTGQSFATAAEAAKEFSRQGLDAAETIKRTTAALTLARIAGMDTAKSVDVITASINGFNSAALDATEIVNKLATVDARFAVSSSDLAEGLARAGAAASDAGVNIDQFIGLVTAAQEKTARGGAVIGNALKTIFTRVERQDTIEAFRNLGVVVDDVGGQVLTAIPLLQNFAKTYDQLSGSIKKQAAELVGGVYQINILKALLTDLASVNGTAAKATLVSAGATDEATRRNAALNKTLATTLQQLSTTSKQIGSNIGSGLFGDQAKGVGQALLNNPITSALKDATGKAETLGGQLAQGLLKGLGNALVFSLGPLIAKAITRAGGSTVKNVLQDFYSLAGIESKNQQIEVIQRDIVNLYRAGGAALQTQLNLLTSVAEKASFLRQILQGAGGSGSINVLASEIYGMGGYRRVPKSAGGYIPLGEEAAAIAAGVGGAPASASPVYLPNFNRGGGQRGIVANTSEWIVPNMAGGSAIYNPDMIRKMGLPAGAVPVAAEGYSDPSYYQNLGYGPRTRGLTDFSLGSGVRMASGRFASNDFLAQIEGLIDLLGRAGDGASARKLGQNILTLTNNLNRVAQEKVWTHLGETYSQFDSGMRGNAFRRKIFYGGVNVFGERASAEIEPTPFPEVMSGIRGNPDPQEFLRQRNAARALKFYENRFIPERMTQSAISRQATLNSATQALGGGEAWENLSAAQQRLYTSKLRLQAISSLGYGDAPLLSVLSNRDARGQIDAQVAQQIASLGKPQVTVADRVRSLGSKSGLALAFAAPLATSFLPEGRGGTNAGIGLGALQGAGNLGGFGASLGLAFGGPVGALTGLGIGGTIGALVGALGKLNESFEEVARQINSSVAELQKQSDTVASVFRVQQELKEAIESGAPETKLNSLRTQRARLLSQIPNAGIRELTRANINNPEGLSLVNEALSSAVPEQTLAQQLRLSVLEASSSGSILSGFNEGAEQPISKVLAQILAGLPRDQQLEIGRQRLNDPRGAFYAIGEAGGLGQDEIFKALQGASRSAGIGRTTGLLSQAINDAFHRITPQTGQDAADPVTSVGAEGYSLTRLDLQNFFDSLRRAGISQRNAQIRFQGDSRVRDVQNKIALDVPGLFGEGRITRQTELDNGDAFFTRQRQRSILLSGGAENLRQGLGETLSEGAANRLRGLKKLEDYQQLLKDIDSNTAPVGLRTNEFRTTLQGFLSSISELDVAYETAIGANNRTRELLLRQYRERGTRASAIAEGQGTVDELGELIGFGNDRGDLPNDIAALEHKRALAAYDLARRQGVAGFSARGQRALGFSLDNISNLNAQEQADQAVLDAYKTDPESITGSQLSGAGLGFARRAGMKGDAKGSFFGGFRSVLEGAKRDLLDFSEIGAQVAQSLQSQITDSWTAWVTGAKRGKDAFRDFAASVLGEASRMFASKAFTALISSIPGFAGPAGATGGLFTGSAFHFAAGGRVPAMLTGGEYVIGPRTAQSIGYDTLKRMNNGYADGGMVRGGSGVKDDVPANLAPGSFVLRRSAVQRLGPDYLNTLASGGVAHRFLGGLIGMNTLWGGLAGAGVGALLGGKRGAIGGALLGGSLGSMYGLTPAGGGNIHMPTPMWQRGLLGLGVAGGLGMLAGSLSGGGGGGGSSGITLEQVPALRAQLEAQQMGMGGGRYAYLAPGGASINSWGDAPATRRWSEGGAVDAPIMSGPSGGESKVSIEININNNGQVSAGASRNGDGGVSDSSIMKLQKAVKGWVKEELVQQSRPDGFFSQGPRFGTA